MQHRNNPIQQSATISTSTLGVRIDLGGGPQNLGSFGWSLNETDNGCNTSPDCSDDIVTLTSSVSGGTVSVGNPAIQYNLIIQGFTKLPLGTTSCGQSPAGSVATTWQTVEGEFNYGCLWGQLRQIRPLTILKVGIGAANPPAPRPRATRTARPCRRPSRAPMTAAPATPASSAWLMAPRRRSAASRPGTPAPSSRPHRPRSTGYTWGPITYTPATIVISTKGGTFEIVVGNSITRDRAASRSPRA